MTLPLSQPDIRVGDLVTWVTNMNGTGMGIVLKVIRCQHDLDGTSMANVKLQFNTNKPCYFIFDGSAGYYFLGGIHVELVSMGEC